MKTLVVFALSLLAGLGIGCAAAYVELGGPDAGSGYVGNPLAPEMVAPGEPQPIVSVDKESYDFGSMEAGAKGVYKFMFSNTGQGPLRLTVGDSTCSCTVGKVAGGDIPPDATVPVTLEWEVKTTQPTFRQSATILTNDPSRSRVTLTVSGKVRRAAVLDPPGLALGSVRRGEGKSTQIDLLSYEEEAFEIKSLEWLDVPEEFFTTEVQELAAAEIRDPVAKAGRRINVKLAPNAPTGLLNGWLRVTTSLRAMPMTDVPVSGKVVSHIRIVGVSDYRGDRNLLNMGAVRRADGAKKTLVAIVTGEHAETVEIEVESVAPEQLEVTIEATRRPSKTAAQIPIAVHVPPGARSGAFLGEGHGGYGKIVLKTNHPEVPQLEVKVSFTVGE